MYINKSVRTHLDFAVLCTHTACFWEWVGSGVSWRGFYVLWDGFWWWLYRQIGMPSDGERLWVLGTATKLVKMYMPVASK